MNKILRSFSLCSKISLSLTLMAMLFCHPSVSFGQENVQSNAKSFVLTLDQSRLFYKLSSNGISLSVSNNQDFPILVQTTALSKDHKPSNSFVVTPPLFRLDQKKKGKVRILRVGGAFPDDRESLQFICVKGIPPKNDDYWAQTKNGNASNDHMQLDVQVSVNSCIKMFVRPKSIKGSALDFADKLLWTRAGASIKVDNPTPYYMNLASVSISGEKIKNVNYIEPFSSASYTIPSKLLAKSISWTLINDFGGVSRVYSSEI